MEEGGQSNGCLSGNKHLSHDISFLVGPLGVHCTTNSVSKIQNVGSNCQQGGEWRSAMKYSFPRAQVAPIIVLIQLLCEITRVGMSSLKRSS